MQVSVEKVSNIERRVTIIVPAQKVEEAYSKQINELAKNAKIKGFRPGKAPLSYIQERFGADAQKEAFSQVIQQSLLEALTNEKLRPINTPKVEPKMMLLNQPLEYIASFEVLPEIGKVTFAADSIEKLVSEIASEDVERVITQLQKQLTQWKVVTRPAKEHDRVVIDYYAIFEGKEERLIKDYPLELGSGLMLPGFEAGLIGAQVGEERKLNLQFPADFSVAVKAGKAIDFVVTVKQILEADVPVLDEALVTRLGIQSGKVEDLQNQIKQSLEQERDRLVNEKLKEQVFQKLLDQNPIDVPQSLVQQEAKNIHDEVYQNQPHNHDGHNEQELTAFSEAAKKRVALGLLVAEYAKEMNLKPENARVAQRIQEIAAAYEQPKEVIAWLSTDERRKGIEAQILEDQVIEKLIEGVKIDEKKINYAELKGIRI